MIITRFLLQAKNGEVPASGKEISVKVPDIS